MEKKMEMEKNIFRNIIFGKHLKFEGEYLNGKKNGKGKEYFPQYGKHLKFEGEYLNGKKNGEGKEYNEEGNLKFEGEYLNGKRWNGKGFDGNNKIVYELKNGNGIIKEYEYNSLYRGYEDRGYIIVFEGLYLKGEKNGMGKEYYKNGRLKFEGDI